MVGLTLLPATANARAGAPKAAKPTKVGPVELDTVPALAGVRFTVGTSSGVTDATGVARLSNVTFLEIPSQLTVDSRRLPKGEVASIALVRSNGQHAQGGRRFTIGLSLTRTVTWDFTSTSNHAVSPARVTAISLRGSNGQVVSFTGAAARQPATLESVEVQQGPNGLSASSVAYRLTSVTVAGGEAVNKGQQRFVPATTALWHIRLGLFTLSLTSRDTFFGGRTGSGVKLTLLDGSVRSEPFDQTGYATFGSLPRGSYKVALLGGGPLADVRTVRLSRTSINELPYLTTKDALVLIGGIVVFLLGLAGLGWHFVRRRRYREQLQRWEEADSHEEAVPLGPVSPNRPRTQPMAQPTRGKRDGFSGAETTVRNSDR
jgi:hypothetical protein